MNYWLMKSEPGVYGIENLKKDGKTHWDGVRNFTARNHIRAMKKGDRMLFYHSSSNPSGVAGIGEIVKEAYPDPTAFDPKHDHYDPKSKPEKPSWFMVDVKFVKRCKELIPAAKLKATPGLQDMCLFKYGRLSVQPVTEREWKIISAMKEMG
jgi:predicted RNA-binding protein with PUA-like domain